MASSTGPIHPPITPLSPRSTMSSELSTSSTSSTSSATSTSSSVPLSPLGSTPDDHNHHSSFMTKVKSIVPHKKPQHPTPPPSPVESSYCLERDPHWGSGRHSNEWLFGNLSVRRAVTGLFNQQS